jgi:putative cell wall-binding protein
MSIANDDADLSIAEPLSKKKNEDVIINELDSDSPAETESYAHAPLSNFYFFAN